MYKVRRYYTHAEERRKFLISKLLLETSRYLHKDIRRCVTLEEIFQLTKEEEDSINSFLDFKAMSKQSEIVNTQQRPAEKNNKKTIPQPNVKPKENQQNSSKTKDRVIFILKLSNVDGRAFEDIRPRRKIVAGSGEADCLLDTDASISLISKTVVKEQKIEFIKEEKNLKAVNYDLKAMGFKLMKLENLIEGLKMNIKFHIVENMNEKCILGYDAIERFNIFNLLKRSKKSVNSCCSISTTEEGEGIETCTGLESLDIKYNSTSSSEQENVLSWLRG